MARRFTDAKSAYPLLDEDQRIEFDLMEPALFGTISSEYFTAAYERMKSGNARYAIEVGAGIHARLSLLGRLNRTEAKAHLNRTIEFAHQGAEQTMTGALGIDDLSKGRDFDRGRDGVITDPRFPFHFGELLSLRALRDGIDQEFLDWHAQAATRKFRSRTWIRLEMLLDHLGYPLPPVKTQWPEPIEGIRKRWVGHYTRLLNTH